MCIIKFPEAGRRFSVRSQNWKGLILTRAPACTFSWRITIRSSSCLQISSISWLLLYKRRYLDNHWGFKHSFLFLQYRWISMTASSLSPIRRPTVMGIFSHLNHVTNVFLLCTDLLLLFTVKRSIRQKQLNRGIVWFGLIVSQMLIHLGHEMQFTSRRPGMR